ncbi:hypothetical protein [uncultured Shewanella sp.]|nr:hypothetical protein [uncultured Shewanella sp.]
MREVRSRREKSQLAGRVITYFAIALIVILYALNRLQYVSDLAVITGVFICIAVNAGASLILSLFTKEYSISSLVLTQEEKPQYFIALSFLQVVLLASSLLGIYLLNM